MISLYDHHKATLFTVFMLWKRSRLCLGAGTGEALSKSYSVIVYKYSSKFPAEKTSCVTNSLGEHFRTGGRCLVYVGADWLRAPCGGHCRPRPTLGAGRTAGLAFEAKYLLNEIKNNKKFKDWELVRISRLSVMPVPKLIWDEIIKISQD